MIGWELSCTCIAMHRNIWLTVSSRALTLWCIATYDGLRALVHLHCDVSQRVIGWEISCTSIMIHHNVWLAESYRALALWCIATYDWLRDLVHLHCDASQRVWLRALVHLHCDSSQRVFGWEFSCTCIVMHHNVWVSLSQKRYLIIYNNEIARCLKRDCLITHQNQRFRLRSFFFLVQNPRKGAFFTLGHENGCTFWSGVSYYHGIWQCKPNESTRITKTNCQGTNE